MNTKCALCKDLNPNQSGSHIFSFFLIRDAINKENKKRRENEIAFELSADRYIQTYFGSEILPAEIERIRQKELTETEILDLQSAKNPFTEDYFICSSCEDNLSTLENFVSANIFDKLRSPRKESQPYTIEEYPHPEAMRLFIYSLCWRAAVVDYGGFRMRPSHQEQLRRFLHENLAFKEADLLANCVKNSAKIKSLPLLVVFLETKGKNNNYIYSSWSENPYWMIINDFHFQLFFNVSGVRKNEEKVFGINTRIRRTKSLNENENKIKISLVVDEDRLKVVNKVARFMADKMMVSVNSIFSRAFRDFFGKNPPPGYLNYFNALIGLKAQTGSEYLSPVFLQWATFQTISRYSAESGQPFKTIDPQNGDIIYTFAHKLPGFE